MNKEQQKFILIGIGVIVLFYLYFSFLFLPISGKVKTLKLDYESNKRILEDAKQKANMLPALEKDALKLKEELYFTMKRIPFEEDIPGLIKIISSIALDNDLHITNFEPQKQVQKDFYIEIPFKLSITGSYHKLGEFLNNLSYQPRLIVINDIQLAMSAVGGGNTISTTVLLSSYMTKATDQKTKAVLPDEERLSSVSIKPLYLYDKADKRDPFKPLSVMEVSSKPMSVAINTLRLTGIISLYNIKTATLEDVNSNKYTLTDGVLYANDMSVVDGFIGSIDKDKVILKQINKETKKLKVVILELKRENEK